MAIRCFSHALLPHAGVLSRASIATRTPFRKQLLSHANRQKLLTSAHGFHTAQQRDNLLRGSLKWAAEDPRSLTLRFFATAASSDGQADSLQPEKRSLAGNVVNAVHLLAKWVVRLAAVVALVAALLPTILSTQRGLGVGLSAVNHFTPGVVHVQEASLGWTKPVRLQGLSVSEPDALGGKSLATAKIVSSNSKLWQIATGKAFNLIVSQPWVDCSLAPNGQLRWTQLLNYEAGKATTATSTQAQLPQKGEDLPPTAAEPETATLPFTAEARLLTANVYIADGTALVPKELKEVVGKDVHLTAVMGSQNLILAGDELELDTAWVEHARPSHGTPDRADKHSDGRAARPNALDPTVIAIRSPLLDAEMSGWRTKDGMLLRRPARAQFQFTPALAEYGLTKVSPLLKQTLAVQEGTVSLTVRPEGMVWPAPLYRVRIEPLRVAVGRGELLGKAIDFLRLRDSKDTRAVSRSSELQGCTSAIHVNVAEDGPIDTKRLDLLVSPGGKSRGVHLAMWGRADVRRDQVDMALAIPSETLALAGIKGVPADDMLVIPVRGTAQKPRVDWVEAYRRFASVAAKAQTGKPQGLRGKLLRGVVEALDMRANAPGLADSFDLPKPMEPLPWEHDSAILHDIVEVHPDHAQQI